MRETPETSSGDLFESRYMTGAHAIAKLWAEQAALDREKEDELNKLKVSNIVKLGLLKKKQEQEILDSILAAELQMIKKRGERLRAEAEEEAESRLSSLLAVEEGASAARQAEIRAQVEREKKAKLKQIDELIAYEADERQKQTEKELEDEKKALKKKLKEEAKERRQTAFGRGKDGERAAAPEERIKALKEIFGSGGRAGIIRKNKETGEEYLDDSKGAKLIAGLGNAVKEISSGLADLAKKYEKQMDEIAGKKGAVDTRLYGSSNKKSFGSYWDKLSTDITGFAGVSPLVKQSAVAERVVAMVGQGIAFNVEQRATLDVIKDKIATTFDAANGTLLRLVRIQQQDTTAGRLGMEAALNEFLNNMYETTEYMSTIAKSVKGSLEEAMSLMTGENALSFEYQIQKWLGSLSSVGMSDSAVQGLAGILGQVAAGKIEGITNGGQGNLVIMAANRAGVNVSDILNNGLDQNTTNTLMNSMVDYLAKIYSDAGNSKVIQQQIASVYGLSASDLKAAVNLSGSGAIVARDGLNYESAMGRLYSMADSMWLRTSFGELLSNAWDNLNYTMAAGMGSNPITYAMFKVSNLLEQTVGDGLNFSLPIAYGTGSTMTFDIPDLLRAGAMAGGVLAGLGSMMASGGMGGLTGRSILRGIGITGTGISTVTRGNGGGLATMGGATVSESGSMVGNASGDDVTNKTMTEQSDQAKSDTASAVDESDETKLSDVDSHVVTIIEILREIADGNSTLRVAIEGDVRLSSDSINGITSGM